MSRSSLPGRPRRLRLRVLDRARLIFLALPTTGRAAPNAGPDSCARSDHFDRHLVPAILNTRPKSPDTQTRLQREIAATDHAIDQLVYQLYNLTPEEIALVEQATAPAKPAIVPDPDDVSPVRALPPPEAYARAEADAAHYFFAREPPTKRPE